MPSSVLLTRKTMTTRDGRLVELLPELAGASRPFSVMYPAHRHMPLRVRVFIGFLVQRLAR
jgi:DNA-binding transcriptional LysR family regulator